MAFWGIEIKPGKFVTQELDEPIHLTHACLSSVESKSRSSLILTVDEEEFTICHLIPEKCEQQTIDIEFSAGSTVGFKVKGSNPINIMGKYLEDEEDMMMDDDMEEIPEDLDEEILSDEVIDSDYEIEEETDEEGVVQPKIVEINEAEEDEKNADENDESEEESEVEELSEDESEEEITENKKASEKEEVSAKSQDLKRRVTFADDQTASKQAKVQIPEKQAKNSNSQGPQNKQKQSKVHTLPSGLVIEDKTPGTGARAKNGKRVSVRYVGKLMNGKVFDSNTSGKPLKFMVGRGEVIKGWDMGVNGMQVGGVRRLKIPPALAYGKQGAPPDIPKNATLMFDVKLLAVN